MRKVVATSTAPGYGYEACGARHDRTYFLEDSEFYMTFLGPLNFIDRSRQHHCPRYLAGRTGCLGCYRSECVASRQQYTSAFARGFQ